MGDKSIGYLFICVPIVSINILIFYAQERYYVPFYYLMLYLYTMLYVLFY